MSRALGKPLTHSHAIRTLTHPFAWAAAQGGYKITDRSKAIMPLTVKLLDGASQNTPTDPWVIDKVELSFGRIVGRLLDMTDDSSTFRFLVHDGTGSIQFTHYVEQGEAWSLKRGSLECVAALPRRSRARAPRLPPPPHAPSHSQPPPPPRRPRPGAGWASTWTWCLRSRATPPRTARR